MAKTQTRRKDTSQRIQDTALELFLEHGYEKTSLREIAERLDVTKAALYYHFKTKEDIVLSLLDRLGTSFDELIAWAEGEPPTLETRRELLRRLNEVLADGASLFRFLQENQAALRDMRPGEDFKERMKSLGGLMADPEADMVGCIRSVSALFTVYFGGFALTDMEGTMEEKRAALLQVADEMLTAAHARETG
ncbi:TetR/AcrR family transcriptional regulator [Actinomadura rudentiformis]|uniref:TetR/AcrR family transcriptional regulator n=1 Tax=Actinomadura rudentiformis TaxID=359158 RepID=A0A6H9YKI9_9ACTN|nr:TetR/AcrR family transcriptional regulator [Actinomadura rudentiformis]KAB2342172.1 TetR/AcrR family transcriptional regulator [Actinomadura rudentiformis]